MEIQAVGTEHVRLILAGLEWDALRIPVIRSNEHAYPRSEPRHGWPRWRGAGAIGRADLIAQIRRVNEDESDPRVPMELIFPRSHVAGLIEILEQNKRVEGTVPMVPRELVTQMIAAIRAWNEGRSDLVVETARITSEFNAHHDAKWGERSWSVATFNMTRRKAYIAAFLLRILRLGDAYARDPREEMSLTFDFTTATRWRAALSRDDEAVVVFDYGTGTPLEVVPSQARGEMDGLINELDDFLAHARMPKLRESIDGDDQVGGAGQ